MEIALARHRNKVQRFANAMEEAMRVADEIDGFAVTLSICTFDPGQSCCFASTQAGVPELMAFANERKIGNEAVNMLLSSFILSSTVPGRDLLNQLTGVCSELWRLCGGEIFDGVDELIHPEKEENDD